MALGAALLITGGVDERDVPFKLVETIGTGRLFDQIPYLVAHRGGGRAGLRDHPGADPLRPLHVRDRLQRRGRAAGRRQRRPPPDQGLRAQRHAGRLGRRARRSPASAPPRSPATRRDNLDAIAAIVIGGTSLFGGVGTIVGTVVGVFIPAVLAQRLRDRRRPAVLAAGRRRRRADRRRLHRPAPPRHGTRGEPFTPTPGGEIDATYIRRAARRRRPCSSRSSCGRAACGDDEESAGGGSGAGGGGEEGYTMTLDRRRQGRRVLHHDELRRAGRGREAGRHASTSRVRTSSTPRCRPRSSTASSPRSRTRS